ncbi:MAG: cysteine--1-D-myo-inosityl 2-amino-2-deoxy-alpha-D-glucopyranoside ligase, partial [Frankiaceae bacterium]|nr:cysteine--1-D-myo-inosityl 2-amino-2-deoxy-alpha-D-glucopyranoside ligase [Frankiaceae bacterium]
MRAWPTVDVPALPGPPAPLRLHDTATGTVRATLADVPAGDPARMYVCGITPYDAAHLGHAATYLAFDLINRVWRDNGRDVHYVQNITDIDDPLLERAAATGQDWTELAQREIQVFREDMAALQILPPRSFIGAVEYIPRIAQAVGQLLERAAAYRVDRDVYFPIAAAPAFGRESGLSRERMLALFAERGGDPERAGKRDPLDSLLWRAHREGEPHWDGGQLLGPGRPGWHIECSVIAMDHLGMGFDLQGGGSDLIFPHHEHSAAHAEALTGSEPFARHYAHVGMIGLGGQKMSKSRGNLVFVSRLRGAGADPMAIRLALLDGHYRADRDWTAQQLAAAQERLARWRAAAAAPSGPDARPALQAVRERLADDLDTDGALGAVDDWADAALSAGGGDPGAGAQVAALTAAL